MAPAAGTRSHFQPRVGSTIAGRRCSPRLRLAPTGLLIACLAATPLAIANGQACPDNGLVVNDLLRLTNQTAQVKRTSTTIEAEFQNISGKQLVGLSFIPNPLTNNIDASTEPSADDILAPGGSTGPLTFTVQHGAAPFTYVVDACAVERYRITLTTFIPFDFGRPGVPLSGLTSGLAGLLSPLLPVIPNLVITGKGDARAFDKGSDDFRTRQDLIIDVDANGPRMTAAHASVASTELHAVDENFFLTPVPLLSVTGILMAQPLRVTPAAAGFTIRLAGNAHTAFLPAALDIDWAYDVTVDSTPGVAAATAHVAGQNDSYPAYELYINGKAFVLSFPPANNLGLLAGTGGVLVDRTRDLAP